MLVFAINPGNVESGYVVVDSETYIPIEFGKVDNFALLDIIDRYDVAETDNPADKFVIEMIGHYGTGMPAGKTVYETCIWIGRFIQTIVFNGREEPELIKRATIKASICGQVKAKDGNVIQALKDRFGDKGTKANHGFFYGFKADCWQAYALAVYYIDSLK